MLLLTSFYNVYVNLPNQESQLDSYISDNPSSPLFEGALGALDGPTSMHDLHLRIIHILQLARASSTQNVLAATTFDMHFL